MAGEKILVVEDDNINQDMLVRRLERSEYEVITANDGLTALQLISEEMPNLILLDIGLPVMDGWQVVEQIKSDEKTAAIPVIALTAYSAREDYERSIQAGCDYYFAKPLKFDELLVTIHKILGE